MKVLTGTGDHARRGIPCLPWRTGTWPRPQAYQAIQQYVDVPALIDYMLMIYYTGSRDAPVLPGQDQRTPRNFYAIRSRNPPGPSSSCPGTWSGPWRTPRRIA